ncbi:MAG: deoxyribodipyrimidine photolyase, partial [Planctomycetota bacterium]
VTDEYPCFFLPHLIDAVRHRIPARLELVDSNGLLPLRSTDRTFTVAHSYRRFMQKHIVDALQMMPDPDPASDAPLEAPTGVPDAILKRWPAADFADLLDGDGISSIPIDHDVPPVEETPGGSITASKRLDAFLKSKFDRYDEDRNHPDEVATSGMSPYLHFGHLSAHEFVTKILDHEEWTPDNVGAVNGKNSGFFGVGSDADAILDQLLTWREIGFNIAFQNPDTYDKFESIPDWAKATLAETLSDDREYEYTLEEFENARTHDELWNAAQREIVQTGRMHNYMRMLWGKKILHWTKTPQDALEIMIHLNNKYGLDGRDPNSYCGILWVLGRTDRAWGPKRPIFGSVRYMTSDSTRRKVKLKQYLDKFGPQAALF